MLNYILDSDLKAGMLVVLKNGDVGVLLPWCDRPKLEVVGRLGNKDSDLGKDLHAIADATLHNGNEDSPYAEFDIVEVYDIDFNNAYDALDPQGRTLLWKYEKPVKELTVKQIEKLLGYKIKIVGEKS